MSNIPTDPKLPFIDTPNYRTELNRQLYMNHRAIAGQLNDISEGKITAVNNTATAAPTTGTYQQGDIVRNSNPTELGSAGSKYIIFAWINVSAGSPGTFKECRFLTGG